MTQKKASWEKRFDNRFFDIEAWCYWGGKLPRKTGDITYKAENGKKEIKSFIAQEKAKTAREVLGKVEKLVAKDRLIFLKNDIASLVLHSRDLRVRKQLRKEILKDFKDLKKKYGNKRHKNKK